MHAPTTFFAVFERAPAALEAALAIQRAMQAAAWPGGIDVRLRIGMHRGRPALTDTGYVGLAVNAAARICSAAHGGQIVMSSAVRAAVLESLAEGLASEPWCLAIFRPARAGRSLPGGRGRPARRLPAASIGHPCRIAPARFRSPAHALSLGPGLRWGFRVEDEVDEESSVIRLLGTSRLSPEVVELV